MKRLIWLHDEALALFGEQLLQADDVLVFVWDKVYFQDKGWSLKRLVFLYESLLDLPYPSLQVYQGDTLEVLMQLRQEYAVDEIVTFAAIEPELNAIFQQLEKHCRLQIVDAPSLLKTPLQQVPKRFFKFWKQVETEVLGEKVASTRQRVR